MRRFQILTFAFVCLAAAILVPGATAGNFDEGKMGCSGESPAICPTATVGQGYSLTIYLSGDPGSTGRGEDFECATFHVSSGSLPPGLSISDEGILSGTPTAAGGYPFFLTVQYDKEPGCAKTPSDDSFVINVNPQPIRLFVSTNSLPDANIRQAYTAPLAVANGTVSTWTLAGGTLPPGLTLGTNGVISGTPTQAGTFTFTVQANGTPNNDTKTLSLFVLAPLDLGLAPTGAPVPRQPITVNMKLATPFSWGIKATGGREPYTYTADRMPAGITLNPDGTVTGTPTLAGTTRSTITVKDAGGTADTLRVTFTTRALLAFHRTKQPRVGKVGTLYSWRLPVSGASETRIFLMSGQIPPGLELDEETGFLSGTPLRAGTFRVKLWALGDAGTQVSKTYRIKVQDVPRTLASRKR